MKSKCLGLMGGIGVGAAAHYYREIAKAVEAQGRELDLVMIHAETARVLEYVGAHDRNGLRDYFHAFLQRMHAAGAVLAAIPSVTSHFCIRELTQSSPVPLANLFHPVAEEVARRSLRRVSVFGTRFVIQSQLYGQVPGPEYILPSADQIDLIHSIYLRIAADGKGTPEQYKTLRHLAHHVIQKERLDAIILGGTDLALLFDESNIDFPAVDCAALHIRSIVAAL